MAKKKGAKRVIKKPKIKLDSVFNCPFCCNENCVEVSLKKARKQGLVFCRVCEKKHSYPINDLTRPTHVFGMFIEECENFNK